MNPMLAFELLFFAVFGQTTYEEMMIRPQNNQPANRPAWTENLFKVVFGIYMLVSVVVLINLLIAMMSDTYQRIQVIIFLYILCLQSQRTQYVHSSCCFSRYLDKHRQINLKSPITRHEEIITNLCGRKSCSNSSLESICWFLW